MSWIW